MELSNCHQLLHHPLQSNRNRLVVISIIPNNWLDKIFAFPLKLDLFSIKYFVFYFFRKYLFANFCVQIAYFISWLQLKEYLFLPRTYFTKTIIKRNPFTNEKKVISHHVYCTAMWCLWRSDIYTRPAHTKHRKTIKIEQWRHLLN